MRTFDPRWQADTALMLILIVITLYEPRRPLLANVDGVRRQQGRYKQLLLKYRIVFVIHMRATYFLQPSKQQKQQGEGKFHVRGYYGKRVSFGEDANLSAGKTTGIGAVQAHSSAYYSRGESGSNRATALRVVRSAARVIPFAFQSAPLHMKGSTAAPSHSTLHYSAPMAVALDRLEYTGEAPAAPVVAGASSSSRIRCWRYGEIEFYWSLIESA